MKLNITVIQICLGAVSALASNMFHPTVCYVLYCLFVYSACSGAALELLLRTMQLKSITDQALANFGKGQENIIDLSTTPFQIHPYYMVLIIIGCSVLCSLTPAGDFMTWLSWVVAVGTSLIIVALYTQYRDLMREAVLAVTDDSIHW